MGQDSGIKGPQKETPAEAGMKTEENKMKRCIVFPGILGGGVNVLLYLTAIQGISSEMYEAAALDGCVGWKKIWHIILPNIRFIVVIQLILTCITTMPADHPCCTMQKK